MTDTPKIEPALTPEEWRELRAGKLDLYDTFVSAASDADTVKLIAALNDDLPDSDRRKITREKIGVIRLACIALDTDEKAFDVDNSPYVRALVAFADALESYLPPPEAR